MSEIKQYKPGGYNPSTGIYSSSYIFAGDWSQELSALNYTRRTKVIEEVKDFDDAKGIATNYLYNSFKSANGESTMHDQEKDFWEEEAPQDYQYTKSYYSSPKLKAMIDWFQCEKSRIRIFQQQPGHSLAIHTDFDNQKGTEHGETLRIFVQLTDMPGGAWFHFKTADSQVHINLQKGQFLIFNPDHTGHGTENLTDVPRNTFMMVVKRNEWIDNIINNETMQYINIDELVEQKIAA